MAAGIDDREGSDPDDARPKVEANGRPGWLRFVPSALRNGAYLFLLVGFGGAYVNGESPVDVSTIYGVLFFVGVGCAVGSIYLGLYLQREDD